MSEQNPFGAPDGGVAVAERDETAEETPAGGPRHAVLAVLGLALAVVLGLAAYFLFFSGGSDDAASGTVPPAAAQPSAAQPSAKPSASAPAPAPVPPTFDESVGTDPFEPAVVAPAPSAPAAGTAPSAAPSTPAASGTTVKLQLLSVKDDSSALEATVDGTTYKGLEVGSSFATYFKVYGIFDGSCAGFLFGDQTVALCEGDAVNLTK